MSTSRRERLYNLLPAIYRQRDAANGETLRALLAIMEQELVQIEAEIGTLYENWFIETCEEWVIPYIADLLGMDDLTDNAQKLHSPRAMVGNAIAYRRRKGIAGVLERVARDLTGWDARVVEFFEVVATTQHVQHVRPGKGATFDIRHKQAVAQLGTAFDAAAHLADVRRVAAGRGRHNLGNVGLFVWRLQPYWLDRCEARRDEDEAEPCYYLHPAGVDMPLFNRPQPQPDPSQAATANHLPLRLGRQHRDLLSGWNPALQLFLGDRPVPSAEIAIGDLSDLSDWGAARAPIAKPITAVVDPELGRVRLTEPLTGETLYASYAYAFSADMGGGPYARQHTLTRPELDSWQAVVASWSRSEPGQNRFRSLAEALTAWQEAKPRKAIVRITDNCIHPFGGLVLELAAGQHLVIEAADGMRPCVQGEVNVSAVGPDVRLTFNGLLFDSGVGVSFEKSLNLSLTHSTVRDYLGVLHTGSKVDNACLSISNSVLVGGLYLTEALEQVAVLDSIIDAETNLDWPAIGNDKDAAAPGPEAILERVTVLGPVHVKSLQATDVVFTDTLTVERREEGSVRCSQFSY